MAPELVGTKHHASELAVVNEAMALQLVGGESITLAS